MGSDSEQEDVQVRISAEVTDFNHNYSSLEGCNLVKQISSRLKLRR